MVSKRFLTSLNDKLLSENELKSKYKVIIEKGEDGYFVGEVPELPGCYSQGKTIPELMNNIKEAVELYLETSNQLNQKPTRRFVQIGEVVINA
jgi:predicted RNase H-like HicB family nuclease